MLIENLPSDRFAPHRREEGIAGHERVFQREHGIASLLITHDQDEALSLADRIVVMRDGRIVQDATPTAVYDAPADAFSLRSKHIDALRPNQARKRIERGVWKPTSVAFLLVLMWARAAPNDCGVCARSANVYEFTTPPCPDAFMR